MALPVNQGRHLVDDLLANLEGPQEARPVVAWSDSVTAGALASAGGDPAVADISSTQAVSLAGAYYTYLRLEEGRAPPRVLVLSLIPESYGNDLDQVFTSTYFETCFVRWDEIGDFARTTGRWGMALRMAGYRLLRPPSMVRRASVRRALQALRPAGGLATARIPLLRVAGVDPAVVAEQGARAAKRDFAFPGIPRDYLERLAEETAKNGTRLILMTGALPRSVLHGWRATGYLGQYEGMLRDVAARHPNVRVEPVDEFATWGDDEMYDRMHLKPAPAERYGRLVLARMRRLLEEAEGR